MSLARWRLNPRLLNVQLANTRMSDGAHVTTQRFADLENRIAEIRKQGTIERGPQEELFTDLIGKVDSCTQECTQLQTTTGEACTDIREELTDIVTKLAQLRGLFETMKNSVNEVLRPSSFEPVAQLSSNISSSLVKLESHSTNHNIRRFWPRTLIWGSVGVAAWWMYFQAAIICQQLFGHATAMNVMVEHLAALTLFDISVAFMIYQVYACFKPFSHATPATKPDYDFWVWNSIIAFFVVIAWDLVFNCVTIGDAIWGPGENGGTYFLSVVLGLIVAIFCVVGFVNNVKDNG